jgi:ssDNA-binding Zn-finger/Zn-ribbon topoisomerase 1
VAVLEIAKKRQLKCGIGDYEMKCKECGKKMVRVKFAGEWYWVCADCKIWDEVED